MAKEKLFTPEDFDKPKDKSFWQKYKSWILVIAALLILVSIVLCWIFCSKEEQNEEVVIKIEHTEQVSENFGTQVTITETEDIENKITEETQEVATVSPESNPAQVNETLKPEIKQEVTGASSTVQPVNISENVEAEAMKVIRGNYGNIPERREKLGNKYHEIQTRVNQLKKEGVF